jgi:membrane protease subunit HflK
LKIPSLPKEPIYWVLALILGISLLVGGSVFTVQPEETGVVLRLGRFDRIAGAGLHFKVPFGIERVSKVETGRVMQREYGYRTGRSQAQPGMSEKSLEDEARMLTGDLGVIDLNWTVQYRIKDAVRYLFNLEDVEGTLDHISESVLRRIVGNRYMDDVLTVGRGGIADMARDEIQKLMDEYGTGLTVLAVKLQDVNPPGPVKPAFNEVNEALQEKERTINEAMVAYNTAVPKAQGEARQVIAQAEGYAVERGNRAKGEAHYFRDVLSEYEKAPDVTRNRMYIEHFGETLNNRIGELIVLDEKFQSYSGLFGSPEAIDESSLPREEARAPLYLEPKGH